MFKCINRHEALKALERARSPYFVRSLGRLQTYHALHLALISRLPGKINNVKWVANGDELANHYKQAKIEIWAVNLLLLLLYKNIAYCSHVLRHAERRKGATTTSITGSKIYSEV